MNTPSTTHVEPHTLTLADAYAARGIALTRDAAHTLIGALRRDAYDMRTRGGQANIDAATQQDALARAIGRALASS